VDKIKFLNLDKSFTFNESEEFYDLIQKCFKIRMQNRSKLKAKFILNLITDSLYKEQDYRFNTDMKETFLLKVNM